MSKYIFVICIVGLLWVPVLMVLASYSIFDSYEHLVSFHVFRLRIHFTATFTNHHGTLTCTLLQPEVTSATVDFKEAKAVVLTTAEVKAAEDWQKQCGEKLANHLGTCGFESRLQGKILEVFLYSPDG